MFAITTYKNLDERSSSIVDDVSVEYLKAIGEMPEKIIEICENLMQKCDTSPDPDAKLFKKYVEHVSRNFDLTVEGFAKDQKPNDPSSFDYRTYSPIINRYVEGIFNTDIYRIMDYLDCIRSMDHWLKTKKHMTPSERENFKRFSDEYNTIRECKYYAMVGTTNPENMLQRIYGAVVKRIEAKIRSFRTNNSDLITRLSKPVDIEKPNHREELAKELSMLYQIYLSESENDHTKQFNVKTQKGRIIPIKEFDQWLWYMREYGSPTGVQSVELKQQKHIHKERFKNIGNTDFVVKAELEVFGRTVKKDSAYSGSGPMSIMQAFERYNERPNSESSTTIFSNELHKLDTECDTIIRQHGFVHRKVRLTFENVLAAEKQSDFLTIIGVFAPITPDDFIPIGDASHNRLFCDKNWAHGLDIPLESVIFTQSVDAGNGEGWKFSADDILQMSGRCGRPSKSTISVVYMAGTTYKKCLLNVATEAITNLLLRYKYYKLKNGTLTINAPILDDLQYKNMEVTALLERMRNTDMW